jgi:hypothetical protein
MRWENGPKSHRHTVILSLVDTTKDGLTTRQSDAESICGRFVASPFAPSQRLPLVALSKRRNRHFGNALRSSIKPAFRPLLNAKSGPTLSTNTGSCVRL